MIDINFCGIGVKGKRPYAVCIYFGHGGLILQTDIRTKKGAMKIRSKYRKAFRDAGVAVFGPVQEIVNLMEANL